MVVSTLADAACGSAMRQASNMMDIFQAGGLWSLLQP